MCRAKCSPELWVQVVPDRVVSRKSRALKPTCFDNVDNSILRWKPHRIVLERVSINNKATSYATAARCRCICADMM